MNPSKALKMPQLKSFPINLQDFSNKPKQSGFLSFESSFQKSFFWNLSRMFGSSQNWKIRDAWNLQSANFKDYCKLCCYLLEFIKPV
jgi:hypothetical protein